MATSSSGMLQINTKSVNANPFGLYSCQLNTSGELLNKFFHLKEQGMCIQLSLEHVAMCYCSIVYTILVSLRMTMNTVDCVVS